jgi:hypothetical protein
MEAKEPAERTSRRKLLKRAGVGAAALWAVPLVATTGAAHASPGSGKCGKASLASGQPCHACAGPACGGKGCLCFPTTEGCCFCAQPQDCKCIPTCETSADCPSGWACTYTCCGFLTCAAPCGVFNNVEACAAATGRTQAGR